MCVCMCVCLVCKYFFIAGWFSLVHSSNRKQHDTTKVIHIFLFSAYIHGRINQYKLHSVCVCVWVCGYPKVGVAENHNINDDLYANNVSLPWFSHCIHEYMTNSGSDVCVCLYRCDNFHLEYYKILIHKHEYSKCVYEYARANSRWLYLNINIFIAFSISKETFLRHFILNFLKLENLFLNSFKLEIQKEKKPSNHIKISVFIWPTFPFLIF